MEATTTTHAPGSQRRRLELESREDVRGVGAVTTYFNP